VAVPRRGVCRDVDGHPLLPDHARGGALLHAQTDDACLRRTGPWFLALTTLD
jgi:hypothetical protein